MSCTSGLSVEYTTFLEVRLQGIPEPLLGFMTGMAKLGYGLIRFEDTFQDVNGVLIQKLTTKIGVREAAWGEDSFPLVFGMAKSESIFQ